MPMIATAGQLTTIAPPQLAAVSTGVLDGRSTRPVSYPTSHSIQLFNTYRATYALLYRSQYSIRKCVDFLARNIAQVGLHVFRRLADDNRERVHDHPLAAALRHPNSHETRYRFFENTMADLGIYFNAFWLKANDPRRGLQLTRLPAAEVEVKGTRWPEAYAWTPAGGSGPQTFDAEHIVHFGGYDPLNPLQGLSPMESLRRVIAEDIASGDYRERYWRRGGRASSVITRPKEVPAYNAEQARQFLNDWQTVTSEGRIPLLQQGMAIQELGHSARDAQYLEARQVSDEITAASYHIPLPMVGLLKHATFSNIREQHKHLYQDALGPWFVMIEEQIELQVLAEWEDPRTSELYVESNIQEKLKGTFEEQAAALQTAVGRPWMTANEARARMNLPKSSNPRDDEIVFPLNLASTPAEPPAEEA